MTETQLIPYNVSAYTSSSMAGTLIDNFWGGDGLGFKDILDIVNPLQQLPIVSSLYRELTGDTISTGSRLAGGALLGGPIGLVGALAGNLLEAGTGDDVVGHVLGVFESETSTAATTSSAAALATKLIPNPVSAEQQAAYAAYARANNLAI